MSESETALEILLLQQGIPFEILHDTAEIVEAVDDSTLEDFAAWVRERDCVKRLAFRIGNTAD